MRLLISHTFLFQVLNAEDNLKETRATQWFLDLKEICTEVKSGDKSLFWHVLRKYLPPVLLLIGVWELIVHGNFSLIQVNHILKMRVISHYVDISYVFLYLIFKCFIFIDVIKTVTLFVANTISKM